MAGTPDAWCPPCPCSSVCCVAQSSSHAMISPNLEILSIFFIRIDLAPFLGRIFYCTRILGRKSESHRILFTLLLSLATSTTSQTMTSTCISSPHELASFLKHNPPSCDAQGRRKVINPPDEEVSSSPPPRPYRSMRSINFIHADPRVTEDLLVVLKDSSSEEQARVERIEVHEIHI